MVVAVVGEQHATVEFLGHAHRPGVGRGRVVRRPDHENGRRTRSRHRPDRPRRWHGPDRAAGLAPRQQRAEDRRGTLERFGQRAVRRRIARDGMVEAVDGRRCVVGVVRAACVVLIRLGCGGRTVAGRVACQRLSESRPISLRVEVLEQRVVQLSRAEPRRLRRPALSRRCSAAPAARRWDRPLGATHTPSCRCTTRRKS